jgi:hypothetical protein
MERTESAAKSGVEAGEKSNTVRVHKRYDMNDYFLVFYCLKIR